MRRCLPTSRNQHGHSNTDHKKRNRQHYPQGKEISAIAPARMKRTFHSLCTVLVATIFACASSSDYPARNKPVEFITIARDAEEFLQYSMSNQVEMQYNW
eukprot:scaffold267967_cov18-Prasinocladus_malaysianus.AAC.1